jgi:nuclear inhibitor of protein phosphatase 1
MTSYEVPDWAGKPSVGLHLDVLKETKLIQKLMIDEKKCYLFGRNPHLNDFCIDHGSCSRVHAALVYHKHLDRSFLVDLGSTHGTFIGNYRIEANKPVQLPVDSTFHFGESTRKYILRERPQAHNRPIMEELEKAGSEADGGLLGLPETETELDNLTEFNTAHNRRISMMGIAKDDNYVKKRRKIRITFNEDEEVINPEDVDPTIGRFRNMVSTMVIPNKRQKVETGFGLSSSPPDSAKRHHHSVQSPGGGGVYSVPRQGLYDDVETAAGFSATLSSTLGLSLPNPAPDIDMGAANTGIAVGRAMADGLMRGEIVDPDEPKKKKYAKEAWPGRKPGPALF